MKKRINITIEDYDNDYLTETANTLHMSKSELIGIAVRLLTATDDNYNSTLVQLAKLCDLKHPNNAIPLNKKIIAASHYVKIQVS